MQDRSDLNPWGDEPDSRIRVLLECDPDLSPWSVAEAIDEHGFAVRTCLGPSSGNCNILETGVCALLDGADVVVNLLDSTVDRSRLRDTVAGFRRPPSVVNPVMSARTRSATPPMGEASSPSAMDKGSVGTLEPRVDIRRLIDSIEEAVMHKRRAAPIWGDGFC